MKLFERLARDSRSRMLQKNILFLFCIKGFNILCSLILVPLTLGYLTKVSYGIWMAISSILMWFSFFDVGLGNGMRNYLTKWITLKNYPECRKYIATTFALLSMIIGGLSFVVLIASYFVDFNSLLSVDTISNEDLRDVLLVAVLFTSVNFVVKNVGVIFMSLQKYAVNDLIIFIGHLLSLAIIYILKITTDGSLLYVTLAFTASPVLIFSIAGIILFIKNKELKPSFKEIDFSITKQLMGKGASFFVIQLTSCLVIYGSANLLISHYCGPDVVAEYNIAFRYFNIITIGYTIIIAPLWSAYTNAYVKNDMPWINKTFNRSLLICFLFSALGLLMLVLSSWVYKIWLHDDDMNISFSISLCVFFYTVFFNLNNCVTYLLNGLNTIFVQLLTSLGLTVAYLCIVPFVAQSYGVEGISYCMSGCYAVFVIVHYIQCRLLLTNKANGLWKK